MIMNNIGVIQNTYQQNNEVQNEYHFWTENNIYLGAVRLPGDGQLMYDSKVLEGITKCLAIRWGLITQTKKK